eukprot:15491122-Heterocapsa_arctica.AAC.1
MSDLAHIKAREQEWAAGLGMNFANFFTNCRQEEVAKRSLHKTINRRGKPKAFQRHLGRQVARMYRLDRAGAYRLQR